MILFFLILHKYSIKEGISVSHRKLINIKDNLKPLFDYGGEYPMYILLLYSRLKLQYFSLASEKATKFVKLNLV